MWMIVGLGNPGAKYANNRHNVGFMLVDALARESNAESFKSKFSAEWCKARAKGEDLALLKPQTFMNLSGQSVQPAASFLKVEAANILVVHDELDLPFGEVRLKVGGGHAGHNGLRSIIGCMGTPEFVRLRIGIGRPPADFGGAVADFVLANFSGEERVILPDVLSRAGSSVLDVLARGVTPAMNSLNTKPKAPR